MADKFNINISHISQADYVNLTVVAILGIMLLLLLALNTEKHRWIHVLRLILMLGLVTNIGITVKQLKKESNAEIATVVKKRQANVKKVSQLNQKLNKSQADAKYWSIKANDAETNHDIKNSITNEMKAEAKTATVKQQISSLNAAINAVKADGSPAK